MSWSPDGRQLAFEAGDGIHVMDVPGLGDCAALRERLVVPGGTDPDWGPAEAPAVRGTTGPRVTATVAPAKLRSALRRGLRVSVTSSEAGRVVIVGAFKRKVVAAGTRKLRAPGKYTVTAKFAKKAKRGLVHAKTMRLALAIGVQDADANIAHTKRTVTLR